MNTPEKDSLHEMLQAEIDELRQEVVNLKARLRDIGELCRDFVPKEEYED